VWRRHITTAFGAIITVPVEFKMSCTFTYKQFPEMERGGNKQKQRKIASISEHYGDEDLELSDSDENVDEIHVTHESKQDVSYISKSDSGQKFLTG